MSAAVATVLSSLMVTSASALVRSGLWSVLWIIGGVSSDSAEQRLIRLQERRIALLEREVRLLQMRSASLELDDWANA